MAGSGFRAFIRRVRKGLSSPFPEDADIRRMRREIFAISLPAMTESFLLQLASMVNTIMVGSIGTWAISSIGYCNQPRLLLLAVFQAYNVGATALIAQAKGAGNHEEANRIVHQSVFFSLCLAGFVAFAGYTFATPMVKYMGANEPLTIAGATGYMRYVMISFPANAISLSITACLRGIGRTRVSLIYNVVVNLVNMTIGYLFIRGRFGLPELGITGASLGMCMGQISGMIISLSVLLRGADFLKLRLSRLFIIDPSILKRVSKVGATAMFDHFFIRFGNIMFVKVATSLGVDMFAAHQIAMNLLSMSMMNGQSFGIAATSLLGQSVGKKRVDMGKAHVQLCRRYAMYISLATGAVMIFFGRQLTAMYTDVPEVIQASARMLIIVGCVQPLHSSQQTLAGALRGVGDTKAIATCTFFTTLIFRPASAWTMVNVLSLGLLGVWIALAMDQVLRSCYTMWRFSSDEWEKLRL